ncbi:YbaN family protein [Actibacterium sp. MT2.3-13A]|uniref:YbaN family protein n=1 Tax=Actibacterium sp. MT2.3-13A TaxID=2828332 RepID=UPI001BAD5833|nr:YbaN family protein [Actibacterium sp. MT2.3-13A]
MRYLWAVLGLVCVALAAIGMFLPFLPTVPFLLLAAFFFARSSKRLHHWLLGHPRFGPAIIDWQERGVIRRQSKWLSSASIALAFVLSVAMDLRPMLLLIQAFLLVGVSLFIWSRPEA